MIAQQTSVRIVRRATCRPGVAAVEFAACMPLLLLLLLGLWEIGRAVEVENIMCNSVREGARDASMGQTNLQGVAANLLLYLQSAEPDAFGAGHTVSIQSPVISIPSNAYGYTYWDNTAGRELFTMWFTDVTNTAVTDPSGMAQLDHYKICVSVPYASIGWLPVAQVTGLTRLNATVDWACMVDSPFTIAASLPPQ
jgi:hypothetical protein